MSSEPKVEPKDENLEKNQENEIKKEDKNEEKKFEYYLDGLGGFFLLIVIILVNIGTLITVIIYLNFLIDSKTYNFDRIGLTRLGRNKHFSLCSIHSCVDNWYSSFMYNFVILLVLFFQDIVISSKVIRQTFLKRAIGDLKFYPKYVIRFMNLFNFCMINMLYQPMNFDDLDVYPKLYLSEYFHPIFLLIPLICGLYLIISSLYFHIVLNDELGFFIFMKIIKGEPVTKLGDYLYGLNIYTRIRSPFRAGIMLCLLSFSPKWDLGRALYTVFFWFALYIDGVNDDRFYFEKYEAYRDYIRKVPCRFFDFSFITGKRRNNVVIVEKDEKEKKEEENKTETTRRRRNKKKQE